MQFGKFFLTSAGLGPTNNTSSGAAPTKNTTVSGSAPAPSASGSAPAPAASGNSSSSAGGDGTGVFKGQTNSSNALGHVGPTNFSISQAPYKVKSCDQVLLIPVKRIMDFNDYCQKQDGFFTMSIYMVNLFEAKDSNKLVESITMDKLNNVPRALAGAPGCIDFRGDTKRIAVCLDSPDMVDQLIQAYMDFMRCRMGDNLKQLSWEEMMKHIMSHCKGQNVTTSNFTAGGNMTLSGFGALPSLGGSSAKPSGAINPYYADLKVPGS